jgi:hypothetical protein
VFWVTLQLAFETFLTLRRILRDFVINIKTFSCKISVFFYYFKKICLVLTDFRKKAQISSLIKIRWVGAKLFHADRRTDIKNLKCRFSQFCERSQNIRFFSHFNKPEDLNTLQQCQKILNLAAWNEPHQTSKLCPFLMLTHPCCILLNSVYSETQAKNFANSKI